MEKKRKRIKIYSALEVANICGVVNQTAINWIKNGSLKAFTTPGGQYRVYAEHLVDFLKERGMKVPAEVLESLNDGFVNEKKILIIDTDRVAIKELRDSLADSLTGYSFISAVTSFDAGRLLMAEKPEIIILTEAFGELMPVYCRGNEILLESDNKEKQELFSQVIGKMRTYAQKGISPDLDMITTIFNEAETGSAASNADYSITIAGSSRRVFPRNKNQMHLLELFNTKDLVFAIGPAGTGKTYLAVAKALSEIMQKKYRKLVITRPVVEAGESLGFLPGDLAQKISPYLRPLYDAMESLLSFEAVTKLEEAGVIEVAPLAYMRGRSLDHCYIILDEAQNTTREQMKMFLTRIGEHSRAIVTGDVTQIDLPNKSASGLVEAVKILKEIDDIGFLEFSPGDIVRNRLVKKIIDAYEKNK